MSDVTTLREALKGVHTFRVGPLQRYHPWFPEGMAWGRRGPNKVRIGDQGTPVRTDGDRILNDETGEVICEVTVRFPDTAQETR